MPRTTAQPDPHRPEAASPAPVEGLAAEIGKSTPFDVREEEVFLSLVRTTAWLGEGVAAMLREAGLSTPLYNILRIVSGHAGLAEEEGRPFTGLAVSRIGEHMLTREPDMTRLIDRLEKLGMVVRNRCPEDRRRVLVLATDAGRELADALRPRLEDVHRAQLGHLTEQEQADLIELLHKARAPMRTPRAEAPTHSSND